MPNQESRHLDSLIRLLREGNPQQRVDAAGALGAQADTIRKLWLDEGPETQPAVGALVDALSDSVPGVRSEAADSLGSLGGAAIDAVPALLRLLVNDRELTVSITAAWAIDEIARDSGIGSYN